MASSFGSTGRKVESGALIGDEGGEVVGASGAGTDDPTASTSGEPSKTILQREGIEYDRRQIRRKLRERLNERGQDLEKSWTSSSDPNEATGGDDGDLDEEESVYDDAEFFPWRQRESAVHAAAVGGRTEGRMEGFDSLERALQAHTHNLHYGRGIGWSQQKSPEEQQQQGLLGHRVNQFSRNAAMNQSSEEWTSFSKLDEAQAKIEEEPKTEEERLDRSDRRKQRRSHRQMALVNTCMIMAAVLFCFLFAYYIESIKIDSYETYLPDGYQEQTAVGITDVGRRETEPSDPLTSDMSARRAASATPPELVASPFSRIATDTSSGHRRLMEGPVVGVPRELAARHKSTKEEEPTMEEEEHLSSTHDFLIVVMEQLMDLLQEVTDRNTLTLNTTPQHRALMWMVQELAETTTTADLPTALTERLVQRYALAVLFFATNGHSWRNQAGFLTKGVHECHWNVVDLGASHCENERVRVLQLAHNNLVGDLPPEIALLSRHLTVLDLSYNSLFGRVEESISQQPQLPQHLALEGNSGLEGNLDVCSVEEEEGGYFAPIRKSADCLATGERGLSCPCCTQCCGWDTNKAHYCSDMMVAVGADVLVQDEQQVVVVAAD